MENLHNGLLKTVETKAWRVLFALMLVLSFGAAPDQAVLADAGGVKGHTFTVTFVKWITSLPTDPASGSSAGTYMAGVVGGAVGEGHFAGYIYSDDSSQPGLWLAHVRYEFYGDEHSFIADVNVRETLATSSATFTGVITQGWLKGSQVTGVWVDTPVCSVPTAPNNLYAPDCIPGSLQIMRPSNR